MKIQFSAPKHEAEWHRSLLLLEGVQEAIMLNQCGQDLIEIWLFAVSPLVQHIPSVGSRISLTVSDAFGYARLDFRMFGLSSLPRTRSGRIMKQELAQFVVCQSLPNRLQMKNPHVLREIANLMKTAS